MKYSWKRNSSSSTIIHRIALIHSTSLLFPADKIAVSSAKRSSSSYKQTITKFLREKAPLFSPTSKYLNYNSCPLGCLSACDPSTSLTFQLLLLAAAFPQSFFMSVYLLTSNWWDLLVSVFVIHSFCPFFRFRLPQRSVRFHLHTTLVHYLLDWDLKRLEFLIRMISPQDAGLTYPGEYSLELGVAKI